MGLKTLALACCLVLMTVAFAPNAGADQWNKKTIITAKEPIQVPGKTLPAGTYVMRLAESPSNRHIVQIFNEDESQLQTTVLAIPNYRLQPTGDTRFEWWETPAGEPRALRAWFYPGDNFGQEFAYPRDVAMRLAQSSGQNVPTTNTVEVAELSNAPVRTMTPQGQEQEVAQAPAPTETQVAQNQQPETPAPAPAPEATPQPAPEPAPAPATPAPADNQADRAATPAPEQQPETLPATGSQYPLVGLLGLAGIGAGFAVRKMAAKRG